MWSHCTIYFVSKRSLKTIIAQYLSLRFGGKIPEDVIECNFAKNDIMEFLALSNSEFLSVFKLITN